MKYVKLSTFLAPGLPATRPALTAGVRLLQVWFALWAYLVAATVSFGQEVPVTAPLKIVVISDINGGYGRTDYHRRVPDAIEQIIALKPDLVL